MACNKQDLIGFVRAELSLQDTERLLEHLEGCVACSQLLDVMVRLRANRTVIAATLSPGHESKTISAPVPLNKSLFRYRRWILYAAALLLLAVAVFVVHRELDRQPADLAGLASDTAYPYRPLILRGTFPSTEELFEEGIGHYRDGRFHQAIPLLEAYVFQAPGDADGHFYLGVAHYLVDQLDKARLSFLTGLRVRSIQPEDRFHWYLAQIHLKSGNAAEARDALRRVIRFRGEFEASARDLLARIPRW